MFHSLIGGVKSRSARTKAKEDFLRQAGQPGQPAIVERLREEWKQILADGTRRHDREAYIAFFHRHEHELDDDSLYEMATWPDWQEVS